MGDLREARPIMAQPSPAGNCANVVAKRSRRRVLEMVRWISAITEMSKDHPLESLLAITRISTMAPSRLRPATSTAVQAG